MQKGQGKLEDRIKDRYNGVNDPLAEKISKKVESFKLPQAPEDCTITTLFIGGIDPSTTKETIEEQFKDFGTLNATRIVG
jgi:pre-mRNA-splicing factor RBM22/SLT11